MIRRRPMDARGAAAVEFALIAPALFALMFFVLEVGRMAWTQQTLQETAASAARCIGLKASGCDSPSATRGWAVTRARQSGLAIAPDTVSVTAATICDSQSGMSRVAIASPYANAVGSILPAAAATMTVTACFPAS